MRCSPSAPLELEVEHLLGDPVVHGHGGDGHVVGHGGRARGPGVLIHSLGCTSLYTVVQVEREVHVRRESFGRDRLGSELLLITTGTKLNWNWLKSSSTVSP